MKSSLDLRGVPCPQNSARALMKLSTLDCGEILELFIDEGEPMVNVPESLEFSGHAIIGQIKASEGYWILTVKVGA